MKPLVVLFLFLGVATTVNGGCPRPTGKSHMVLISDITFPVEEGTSVTFNCEAGYRPVGSGTITCSSSGDWSPLERVCQIRTCGSYADPLNGYIDFSEGTDFGAIAKLVCNEGYYPVGQDLQIYCGAQGWEGRLAVCESIKCNKPKPIANGYFAVDKDEYQHSEAVNYFCDGQYKLNGSKTVVCSDDGTFKPAAPTCVLVDCPVPNIDFGIVAVGSRPPYNYLTSVTFRCNVGYTMVGKDTVSCDINSKWSPALPTCTPIECKTPEVADGKVTGDSRGSYKFSETVTIECSEGFKLSGQSTLTCGERNLWSPAIPQCTKSGSNKVAIGVGVAALSLVVQCLLHDLW